MKKLTVFLAFLALSLGNAKAQTRYYNVSPVTIQSPVDVPLHEVRAVWLTTIGGLDWPHSYAQSSAAITRQQNELRTTLDRLQNGTEPAASTSARRFHTFSKKLEMRDS